MFDNLRRVSRQSLAYGTADAAVLAINVVLLPIYTRVLRPAEYGALALLLVFEAVLRTTLRCGLDSAYLRLYYDYPRDDDRRSLAKTVLTIVLVLNGTALIVLWVASPRLTLSLFGNLDYIVALQLVALNTSLSNLVFLPLSLFRVQERASLVGTLSFLRSFGTVVTRIILVIGFHQGVFGLALADVIVTSLLVVGLARSFGRMIGGRFSWPMLRGLLHYGSPHVPHGLLSQVMSTADRYVLGMYLPLSELGVYMIGSSMASMLKLFPSALETAWMPFAFSSLTRRDAPIVFARMSSYAFAVLGFLALGVALFAEPVTRLVLPSAYHRAPVVVPLLALGITIQVAASFLATSINVAKRTGSYPLVTAAGAVASLVGCVVLIPRFGMMGAALGVGCGQTALTVTMAWFAQRYYPIPYEKWRLTKTAVAALALFGVGVVLRTGSAWWDLLVAAGLLVAFPVVLLGMRFLQPWETQALTQVLAKAVRARRGPGTRLPTESGQ